MKLSRKFVSATSEMCTLTENVPSPYLRKNVSIKSDVVKAELSVCGLGFYRFWLNGKEMTKGHLSPYISAPDDLIDYDVYDLTDEIIEGKNTLGFQLGNGMQNAFGGYVWDFDKAAWRSAPKLAMCLEITYGDGSVDDIEADDSFVCAPSPVIYDDLRQGECYDATLEIEGWNLPEFDDRRWKKAIIVDSPRGKSVICEANPIVQTKELKPVAIYPDKTLTFRASDTVMNGWLYDFGENCVGVPRLSITGTPGQKITMIFGEFVTPDGTFDVDNIRFVRKEYFDLPLYIQKDEYTCKGNGVEKWSPVFTYHGFRYALVMGITEEQATQELLTFVVMNTDLKERGNFISSDETLNALQRMTRTTTLGNFYHFPTDCPHREKNGWTADAALSTEHTLLNFDPTANYTEWMRHICASMDERGAIPGIIPTGGWGFDWGNGPAWDQILVTLPYMVFRYRGEKKIVEESLTSLLRYVHYLTTRTDENGLIAIGLGDWCAPYGPRSPLIFTDSVISMDICEKSSHLFKEFGKPVHAEFCHKIAENFRKAVREHLIDFETMTAISSNTETRGCETSQAMAIFYNIFTDEEKPGAIKVLIDKIHEHNDHLDTGVLGTRVIFEVLSEFGYSDLAYKIIVDPTPPSYGNWVARGETTLCEDFNTYEKDNRVNSLNHHFFGSVSAWFIKCICGIQHNRSADDIHHADIEPRFVDKLEHAEAFHITPDGRISVKWERASENEITLTLEYPESMNGEIRLDIGWKFAKCGCTVLKAKSGIYSLVKM